MAKKESVREDINYPLVSYIIGIVAIVQAFISPLSGIILSIIGLILSKRSSSNLSKLGKKFNLIALIIGIVIFILSIILSFSASQLGLM